MRRRLLFDNNGPKPIGNAEFSDVCFYDSENDEFIISDAENIENYAESRYTPIGIVVIPASHTENQRPRLMSLVVMDYNSPDSGSIYKQDINFDSSSFNATPVDGLPLKGSMPILGSTPSEITSNKANLSSADSHVYFPSDANGENGLNNCTFTNPSNSNEHFLTNNNASYMCSPYKQNGGKDTRYFNNALSDFDGQNSTNIIIELDNSNDISWQTANTISNSSFSTNSHPAAQCCWRFHTIGTEQGNWYMPAIGELGYVLVRQQSIQNSLVELQNNGYDVCLFDVNDIYLSSTQFNSEEYDSDCIYRIFFLDIEIGRNLNYGYDNYVRAFLEL